VNRRLTAGTLAGWLAILAANAETADPSAVVDFSVLTPAMEGQFIVASTGIDPTALVPPYLPLHSFGKGQRTDRLRAIIAREGYQPERTIADRLIDRLAEASYRAVYEPIRRRPAGSMQSLAWDHLPEHPRGELMLDVTIRWICMCSIVAFAKYYPAISMSWRLLDPARVVVQPTRTMYYFHHPAMQGAKHVSSSTGITTASAVAYPVETVSESCGFNSVKEMEMDPAALWGCLGEASDAALRRLVIDLKKVHAPLGNNAPLPDT